MLLIAEFKQYFFGISIALTSAFLVLLVLVQRGRGGGLTGALGGAGGQSAFGTKAGDLFTRITIVVAAVWIVLCAGAVFFLRDRDLPGSGLDARPASNMTSTADPLTAPLTGSPSDSPAGSTAPANTAPANTAPANTAPAGTSRANGASAVTPPAAGLPASPTPATATPATATPAAGGDAPPVVPTPASDAAVVEETPVTNDAAAENP